LLVAFLPTLLGIVFGTDSFEYLTWLPAAGGLAAGRIALEFGRDPSGGSAARSAAEA
jgi:hypothetical protein